MKTAVIYWSGTGNTEAMAKAAAEGANAELFEVSEFSGNAADYDAFAFGCPAMGAEVLEEDVFEPFFTGIESAETVIAINTDTDASIMNKADLAITGDWNEILTQLTQLR